MLDIIIQTKEALHSESLLVLVLVDVGGAELLRNPVPEVRHDSSCSLGQDSRSGNTEQITLKP